MSVNSCLLHLLHLIFIIICLPKSLSDEHLAQAFFDSVKSCENYGSFSKNFNVANEQTKNEKRK